MLPDSTSCSTSQTFSVSNSLLVTYTHKFASRVEANAGLISGPEVLQILKERSAGEGLLSKASPVEKEVS